MDGECDRTGIRDRDDCVISVPASDSGDEWDRDELLCCGIWDRDYCQCGTVDRGWDEEL